MMPIWHDRQLCHGPCRTRFVPEDGSFQPTSDCMLVRIKDKTRRQEDVVIGDIPFAQSIWENVSAPRILRIEPERHDIRQNSNIDPVRRIVYSLHQ